MSGVAAQIIALVVLAGVLAGAVTRFRGLSEAVFAVPGALLLLVLGVVRWPAAWDTVQRLASTVGFLAAILVLGHLCAEYGVFSYLGSLAARLSAGNPHRLLAITVVLAAVVTSVLTLDATVVLLTPVVLRTTRRLAVPSRPHLYATVHLANTGSLLLPVSNLTNLLAFAASGLSFGAFTALMAVPWVVVCTANWLALRLYFRTDLVTEVDPDTERVHAPRFALSVLALTVVGFVATSALGVAPALAAFGGCLVLGVPRLLAGKTTPRQVAAEANPGFLIFVFALGVVVDGVTAHGVSRLLETMTPSGESLLALLAIAVLAALLANLINNLPATLAFLPVVSGSPVAVLAVLIGVNVGPNLTYVGSLATLLWRRLLPESDRPSAKQFHLLGAMSALPMVVLATVALWAMAALIR